MEVEIYSNHCNISLINFDRDYNHRSQIQEATGIPQQNYREIRYNNRTKQQEGVMTKIRKEGRPTMIECPWCSSKVHIGDDICPECKHEVLLDYEGNVVFQDVQPTDEYEEMEASMEEMIQERFRCPKCQHRQCEINEVAMTGTGLSKMFDIQYNHYLFVSCLRCGTVEVLNPNIIQGKSRGSTGTILDILFGG